MISRTTVLALVAASSLVVAAPTMALTFKKGQVLGSDGQVYDGASPEQEEALIKRVEEEGEVAGIAGFNLFVVIEGEVTYVPLSEVRGKTKEGMKEVIAAHVLTGAEIGAFAEIEGSAFSS